MRPTIPILLTAVLGLAPAAFAVNVQVDYDHAADFSRYKTYNWINVGDSNVDQLFDQRITAALEEELAKKGFRRNETRPDVEVGFQAETSYDTQLITTGTDFGPYWGGGPGWGWGLGYGFGYGYGYGAPGGYFSTTYALKIPVGTLTFSMFDPARKQLIFRGVATDTLSDKPEKNTRKIQKAVIKMFQKYPYPPKSK
jgi:Domain of unknown function (DUF4136)